MADDELRRAHLNLAESSRRLAALDPGAEIEAEEGWLLSAGSSDHPLVANLALRLDDDLAPEAFLERAAEFFGSRGRGFAVWARGDLAEDVALVAAAEAAGLRKVYAMPAMVLRERPAQALPDGVELRAVETPADDRDYWRIAAAAYRDVGFPPEAFDFYEGLEELGGRDDAVALLADLDGRPVGIALTIVTHGVAGVYWVGSLADARGRGVGRAVTAAVTAAGFDLGAEVASLQASPMGEPIYLRMGYETVHRYDLMLSSAPG